VLYYHEAIIAVQPCSSFFSRSGSRKQPKHLRLAKHHICIVLTDRQRFLLPFLGNSMSTCVQLNLHCGGTDSATELCTGLWACALFQHDFSLCADPWPHASLAGCRGEGCTTSSTAWNGMCTWCQQDSIKRNPTKALVSRSQPFPASPEQDRVRDNYTKHSSTW